VKGIKSTGKIIESKRTREIGVPDLIIERGLKSKTLDLISRPALTRAKEL